MIDPISMMAASAGINLVEKILTPSSTSSAASTQATSGVDFKDLLTDTAKKSLQQALAADPQIRSQLGPGPYTVTLTDGQFNVSNASGASVKIDPNTSLGQKTSLLAQQIGLKNFQKGLELQGV